MEKHIFLTVPFDDFKKQVSEKIFQAKAIHDLNIATPDDLEDFKQKSKRWTEETLCILSNSFNEPINEYSEDFRYSNGSIYNPPGVHKTTAQIIDNEKELLRSKQKSLWDNLRLLEVSDVIARPTTTDLTARSNYTTEDKLNLLLDKLYQLYDDFYYPVRTILVGNGIMLKRHDDDRGLTDILENNGYVEVLGGLGGVNARLTTHGAMYVEDKRKSYKESYEDINKSQEELNSRVDEIIDRLTKLGYGQEIIFDELQEIKELYLKMNKKTWGQVVKGKLVDLALAKLVENDTLKYIYEALTDHKLRLP